MDYSLPPPKYGTQLTETGKFSMTTKSVNIDYSKPGKKMTSDDLFNVADFVQNRLKNPSAKPSVQMRANSATPKVSSHKRVKKLKFGKQPENTNIIAPSLRGASGQRKRRPVSAPKRR